MKTIVSFSSNSTSVPCRQLRQVENFRFARRIGAAVAIAALLAFGPRPCEAQTFLFDFGGANTTVNGAAPADDPVNFWNNVTTTIGQSATGSLLNLVTTGNTVTGAGLMMLTRFNGANENGTLASTLFPSDATRDSLYGNTEIWSGLANVFPSFKLIGLNPVLTYDFTFYASRMSVSDNRETGYTLTGGNAGFAALNASANENSFATAFGLVPNASGEITIAIAPTANNNNAYHFTYLGVMEMTVVPEPSASALMIGGGLFLAWLRPRLRLA
jgi:hypothetical protein